VNAPRLSLAQGRGREPARVLARGISVAELACSRCCAPGPRATLSG
jgi:hypothetical protein